MGRKAQRRQFGQIAELPSGRFRARYADPDGRLTPSGEPVRHNGPHTFVARGDAEAWLVDEKRLIDRGEWTSPATRQAAKRAQPLLFGEYAEGWLKTRQSKGRPLADRTREAYQQLLDAHILPTFENVPLREITPELVERWYERTAVDRPTARAKSYSLLRTILGTAIDRGILNGANPARIRGAGNVERARDIRPATIAELATMVEAMPADRRLMVLLGAWCALRFGELAELRRTDIDTKAGIIRVRRGVVRTKAGHVVKAPKTSAGIRNVPMPPPLLPIVREHLLQHAQPGKDGLLFPGAGGGHLQPSTFYGKPAEFDRKGKVTRQGSGWYRARQAAGREDLPFHGLRHTGAVLYAQQGATLAELMDRLGHTTAAAAMRYQHAAEDRAHELARRLGEQMTGIVETT